MVINQENLKKLYEDYKNIFNQALKDLDPMYKKVAMIVPSSTKEENYSWLGSFPRMREWIGERHVKNLSNQGYTIINKDWETSVEVDLRDIEDNRAGVYNPLMEELARVAESHPDEIVLKLLPDGFTTPCYDGQYFFDTDHPVGDAVVSNFGGGAGTAWYLLDISKAIKPFVFQSRRVAEFGEYKTNFINKKIIFGADRRDNAGFGIWQLAYASKDTLNAANYAAARAAMFSYKDETGRPLGVTPNLLVVSPSLESAGRTLLMAQTDAGGATNPWRDSAELLVAPWLS